MAYQFDWEDPVRWEVYLPSELIETLERLAFRYKRTISMIIREVLENPMEVKIPQGMRRPAKFDAKDKVRRFPICMYGADKAIWKVKMTALQCEFGTFVRYMLDFYRPHLELLASGASHCQTYNNLQKINLEFHKGEGIVCGYQLTTLQDYWPIHSRKSNNLTRWMLYGRYKRGYTIDQIRRMRKNIYGHY